MSDNAAADTAEQPTPEPPTKYGCLLTTTGGQQVIHVDLASYAKVVRQAFDDQFTVCVDLTAVDYLLMPGRTLPDGITAARFEVVVNLLSMAKRERLRIRVQVPGEPPTIPTLFDVHPGTEAMEREVFDMFGIVFDGHPDLTRILMPEDWEGHPLRKDYSKGSIPVQFSVDMASPGQLPGTPAGDTADNQTGARR